MTPEIQQVDDARARLIARREAHEQFERLAKQYWQLRETLTAEAIAFLWIVKGDAMWEVK